MSGDRELIQLAIVILFNNKEIYDYCGHSFYRHSDMYAGNTVAFVYTRSPVVVLVTPVQVRIGGIDLINMYRGLYNIEKIYL